MTSGQAPGTGRRVALVHDWLTGMRGGEKVLERLAALYPDAPIYTLIRIPEALSPILASRRTVTSFVDRLPGATRHYRSYLPLFPAAIRQFDLGSYDLVLSTSHCVAKSAVRGPGAVHVCYCHSPMRYAWDQFDAYFGPDQVGSVRSALMRPIMDRMARWDAATADRVDAFVANSRYVAGRIRRYYNRGSTVVYPPVDTEFYQLPPAPGTRSPRALVVSALVPYKRLDIAIDACARLRLPLTIVGTGPERARLEARAGTDVQFAGWRPDEEIRELYQTASVVLLPGVEDFGMVPVEAQACGAPVVAVAEGGACETVLPGVSGVLADPAGGAGAFAEAITECLGSTYDARAIRVHAETFACERFDAGYQAAVAAAIAAREARA